MLLKMTMGYDKFTHGLMNSVNVEVSMEDGEAAAGYECRRGRRFKS